MKKGHRTFRMYLEDIVLSINWIITLDEEGLAKREGVRIRVKPAWKWMLEHTQ